MRFTDKGTTVIGRRKILLILFNVLEAMCWRHNSFLWYTPILKILQISFNVLEAMCLTVVLLVHEDRGLRHSSSCGTRGPSEIGWIFKILVVNDEDQRHPHQRFDRLHGALLVVRERSHSPDLHRTHGTSCLPWNQRWRQDAHNGIDGWVCAQLGYQVWISDSCFRSSLNASGLHDGITDQCTPYTLSRLTWYIMNNARLCQKSLNKLSSWYRCTAVFIWHSYHRNATTSDV